MATPLDPGPSADRLYKVIALDGSALYGTGRWPLPANGRPGQWMPALAPPLIPCQHRYHLVRPPGLLDWMGPALYLAEPRGATVEKDAHVLVAQQARLLHHIDGWTVPHLVEFAILCAERALPHFERKFPADARVRQALDAARQTLADPAAGRQGRRAAGAAEATWAAVWAAERQWQTATLLDLTGLSKAHQVELCEGKAS